MDAVAALGQLAKAGPFIGPRGGKWADAKHTIAWHDDAHEGSHSSAMASLHHALRPPNRYGRSWEQVPEDTKKVRQALQGIVKQATEQKIKGKAKKQLVSEIMGLKKNAAALYKTLYRSKSNNVTRTHVAKMMRVRDWLDEAAGHVRMVGKDPKKEEAKRQVSMEKRSNKKARDIHNDLKEHAPGSERPHGMLYDAAHRNMRSHIAEHKERFGKEPDAAADYHAHNQERYGGEKLPGKKLKELLATPAGQKHLTAIQKQIADKVAAGADRPKAVQQGDMELRSRLHRMHYGEQAEAASGQGALDLAAAEPKKEREPAPKGSGYGQMPDYGYGKGPAAEASGGSAAQVKVIGHGLSAIREHAASHRKEGRTFRAPHHTVSRKGMVSEVKLAQGGTLHLDEPHMIAKPAMAALFHHLGQPGTDVQVSISARPDASRGRASASAAKRYDALKARLSQAMGKSMDAIENLGRLAKGADRSKEGSRGGRVIGHTASGKPIYAAGPGKGLTRHPDKGDEDPKARHKGKEHYGSDKLKVDRTMGPSGEFHGSASDHRKAHQQAFGTGREGAHPGDGVKVLSEQGLHHAAKEAARKGHEGHLDQIKAEASKRKAKMKPVGFSQYQSSGHHHANEATRIAEDYGTGGKHASKMHRVSAPKSKWRSPDAIDALGDLAKGAGGFGYKSKKPNGRGGWTYVYDHPTEGKTTIETTHTGDHATSREPGTTAMESSTGTGWHDGSENAQASAHSALSDPDKRKMHEHALRDHLGHKKTGKHPPGGRARREGQDWYREIKTRTKTRGGITEVIKLGSKRDIEEKESRGDFSHRFLTSPGKVKRQAVSRAKEAAERAGARERKKFREKFLMPSPLLHTGKKSSVDAEGRPLIKGSLHSFRDPYNGKPNKLPAAYLFPYLCAFVEEAYEHECMEPAHKFENAADLPKAMARAVMSELVQTMPKDTNLRRACAKYKCTVDTIAELLTSKGILKTRSDAMPTDSDAHHAMGAGMLGESVVMAYSKPAPWVQKSDPHVNIGVGRLVNREPANVAHLLRDDTHDPHELVRKGIEARTLSHGTQLGGYSPAVANTAVGCPVHRREMHKSHNLWNPMAPCTCGPTPNAYG